MDAAAATALISAAAGSVATEAGRHAWESLLTLMRRVSGRGQDADASGPEDAADPADERQVRELTGRVLDRAGRDEAFAAALEQWVATHRATLMTATGDVHASIASGAVVHGHVVQARDIHGGVRFGG
jgi:hypothetical protein